MTREKLGPQPAPSDNVTHRDPIIVAHRGLALEAPENTLTAYAAALDLGFGIEIDARLTADGQAVIVHDDSVDRTTDGSGNVEDLSLAQIEQLDAGSWFDPVFAGEPVPTLDMVLGLVEERAPKALVMLDIKSVDPYMETLVIESLEVYGLLSGSVGIGGLIYSAQMRERYHALEPRFPLARCVESSHELEAAIADPCVDWIYLRYIPSAEDVRQVQQAEKKVVSSAPPVMYRNPDNWRCVREAGVDAMITDHQLECRRVWRDARQVRPRAG